MSTSAVSAVFPSSRLARTSLGLGLLFLFGQPTLSLAADKPSSLKQQFQSPPADARLMVRWWWFGTAVEKREILRELQQMKVDGIGGVELAFVYPQVLDDASKNLINEPFVGPEMLDNVRYAQVEARKLGLRVDVTLGSGWPYGGPATTLAEAAAKLRVMEIALPATATSLPKFKLKDGEAILSISVVAGVPKKWDAASARVVDANAMIPASDTPRTALYFVSSHTGQQVKRAAVGSEGWVLDPFSHQAVATHLKAVGDSLVKAFGATPPYAVFSDSLEAYGADWTPVLPEEFKKRRGYDLLPHLPELVAGGTPSAEAVRHDWGKTLTELVDENYLTQINNWAIAHHTKFRSQTYGEPAVTLSSQRLVGLPEGEGPQWRQFSTLRWATSGNHLFGNNVTSGETFTWLHSPVFRATPLDMKAEADVDFIMGENQLIGHGWPYSAPPGKVEEPGWSLYAAAALNDHNPWHPVMPDVARYIQRVSFLLRQGQPANQVALLLPTDDAWSHFAPGKATVTGEMSRLITPQLMAAVLSAGYNVDFIDADAINRLGIKHPILLIPPTDRIPLVTLHKIEQYVAAGGKAISIGRIPSLSAEGKPSVELASLTKKLFDEANHTYVPNELMLADALHEAQAPDLKLDTADPVTQAAVGFIRRKTATADIYFVANTSNSSAFAAAEFATKHGHGEQWDPDTTAVRTVSAARVDLVLAPYESRIFVFTGPAPAAPVGPTAIAESTTGATGSLEILTDQVQVADLSSDWQVKFTAIGKSELEAKLTDWVVNPATKFYSGEAVYTRDFTLAALPSGATFLQVDGGSALVRPGSEATVDTNTSRPAGAPAPNPLVTRTGPGMRAWFDPPIHEAAIVLVNGQNVGSLWHPPYRLDVSKFLKAGPNHIEIRVYNTAINAWAGLPPHDYKPLIAKYGDRFQMQDLNEVKPVASGLLGQIHLVQGGGN
jgi:hypothetical protein